MSLTKDDLTEIKKIVIEAIGGSEERTVEKIDSAITASEERTAKKIDSAILSSENRTAKKIDSAITASEERTAKKIAESEQRTVSKLEKKIDDLTLFTGQGFNEVTGKIDQLDDKIENVKNIVKAEVERNDKQETTVTKIRKQLRAV